MSNKESDIDKVFGYFKQFLPESAKPFEIYKSFITTYKALDREQVHVEEVKIYDDGDGVYNFDQLLWLFNFKGIKELKHKYPDTTFSNRYQIVRYDEKAFIFMKHAFVGKIIKEKKVEEDPLVRKIEEINHTIFDSIEKKYGRTFYYNAFDTPDLEDAFFIGNDLDEIIEKVTKQKWKEDMLKIETKGEKEILKVFVRGDEKNKLIVIPRIEREKIYLKTINNTFLNGKKIRLFNQEVTLPDILQPYESFVELYKKPKKNAIARHFAKASRLSTILLMVKLRDADVKVTNINTFDLDLDFNSMYNARIYEIKSEVDRKYITIMPSFIMKTSSKRPYKIINRASYELREAVEDEFDRMMIAELDTFHHGIWYRFALNNGYKKSWQTTLIDVNNIKVKMRKKGNNIAKIGKVQVGKYFIKRVNQELA